MFFLVIYRDVMHMKRTFRMTVLALSLLTALGGMTTSAQAGGLMGDTFTKHSDDVGGGMEGLPDNGGTTITAPSIETRWTIRDARRRLQERGAGRGCF